MINNYKENASLYSKHSLRDTAFLAFKIIPGLVDQYREDNTRLALDYGCGSGRSSRFLQELNLDVSGVDINEHMLNQAKSLSEKINYHLISNANLPFQSCHFDIAFSFLVMFELSTKSEILTVLNEVYRVLKPGAKFIIVTGSEHMYSKNWMTLNVNYPQNQSLKSGSTAKIKLEEINLELEDYFWTEADYQEVIANTDFRINDIIYPLGDESDGFKWLDETDFSPYVVIVLEK